MKLHYLCLLFLNILLIEAVEVSENELEVELKENAENVCIDQEVQNKILNITYIQSIVSNEFSQFSKLCWWLNSTKNWFLTCMRRTLSKIEGPSHCRNELWQKKTFDLQ